MRLVFGSVLLAVFLGFNGLGMAQETSSGQAQFGQFEPVPEQDYGDNDPAVILCMGDSITQGFGVSGSDIYPAKLQAILGRTVINEGLGGARSTYGVRMINTFLNRYKPGYVLIMFGTNDIGESIETQIIDNLRFMIQRAKDNKSVPIVATLTPVFGPRIGKRDAIFRVNDQIRALAEQEATPLADVDAALAWDQRYLLPDGLHPTAEGLELIAKTFADTIVEFERRDSGGGGSGCTVSSDGHAYGDLVLLFAVLIGIYALPRLYRARIKK